MIFWQIPEVESILTWEKKELAWGIDNYYDTKVAGESILNLLI